MTYAVPHRQFSTASASMRRSHAACRREVSTNAASRPNASRHTASHNTGSHHIASHNTVSPHISSSHMAPNRESAGHVVYRVANKRRFLFMLSCLGVLLVLMASVLSAKAGTDIGTPTDFIVVMEGDTLWELAETHCTKGDLRSYIHEVRLLNGLQNNTIYAGQGLLLPVR